MQQKKLIEESEALTKKQFDQQLEATTRYRGQL